MILAESSLILKRSIYLKFEWEHSNNLMQILLSNLSFQMAPPTIRPDLYYQTYNFKAGGTANTLRQLVKNVQGYFVAFNTIKIHLSSPLIN